MDLIIVNYNTTHYLHACLTSIYQSLNGQPANIHVFDNGSSDNVDRIRDAFPHVNLYQQNQNFGFSKAVNRVLKNTFSPYVVVLNPDTIAKNGLFESARSYLDNNPEVGILGPKILDMDGCVQGSARAFPTVLSAIAGRRSLLTRFFPKNSFVCANILSNTSDGKTPLEVGWVSGACMFVRRAAIEEIGLLDERFFLYWEDVDWCRRMWNGGWKVVYYPKASIKHSVGASSEKNLLRSIYEFHKSAYRYYVKHNRISGIWLKAAFAAGLFCRFMLVLTIQLLRGVLIKIKMYFGKNNAPTSESNRI